jgi:RNA recognition motif-containing protein
MIDWAWAYVTYQRGARLITGDIEELISATAEPDKKLYVGNLAYAVTDQDLKDLFSESGTVESVAVISDKFSGQSKGFGFVEMADAAGAEAAIKSLDGTEFKGRNLKVNEAKPREGGSSGGPRGGGGGGGRSGDRSGGGGRGNRW